MNEQSPGISWTHLWGRRGFTLNPTAGCLHGCKWEVGDQIVTCYAERSAGGATYPHGFRHHYWHPNRLSEPLSMKEPAGIFVGSMADLFGSWVPEDEIEAVLSMMRRAWWHTFFTLTKNASRMLKFDLPENMWAGVSLPPRSIAGARLGSLQRRKFFNVALTVLGELDAPVRWVSLEPLNMPAAHLLTDAPIDWAVIGAASRLRDIIQPPAEWVQGVLDVLDERGIPVYMKSNLEWPVRRTEFPPEPVRQPRLFE